MIELSVIELVLLVGECTAGAGVGRTTRRAKGRGGEGEGFFSLIGRRRDNQLFNFCAGKKNSCGGGKEGDADIALQVGSEILFYGLSAAKVRH